LSLCLWKGGGKKRGGEKGVGSLPLGLQVFTTPFLFPTKREEGKGKRPPLPGLERVTSLFFIGGEVTVRLLAVGKREERKPVQGLGGGRKRGERKRSRWVLLKREKKEGGAFWGASERGGGGGC